eukprot:GHVT01072006.1.p1 GENE.GHVT01072006.1~~GHVT01072006.1.p1  ORF type:complete len:116 (+),score=10.18 GHVT01072006.1:319-666(+)
MSLQFGSYCYCLAVRSRRYAVSSLSTGPAFRKNKLPIATKLYASCVWAGWTFALAWLLDFRPAPSSGRFVVFAAVTCCLLFFNFTFAVPVALSGAALDLFALGESGAFGWAFSLQ